LERFGFVMRPPFVKAGLGKACYFTGRHAAAA
jgi:hypothetical protein